MARTSSRAPSPTSCRQNRDVPSRAPVSIGAAGATIAHFGSSDLNTLVDYFIYYRIARATQDQYFPVVVAMQSEILRRTSVRGRLKRKSAGDDTWMEIYEGVHQRLLFEAAMADCVIRFGLEAFLADGAERHVEIFHDPLA